MPNNDYLDFLAHHGILGQKWGVRRYQNPDGSLTADGRRRYKDASEADRHKAYNELVTSSKLFKNKAGYTDSQIKKARIETEKMDKDYTKAFLDFNTRWSDPKIAAKYEKARNRLFTDKALINREISNCELSREKKARVASWIGGIGLTSVGLITASVLASRS